MLFPFRAEVALPSRIRSLDGFRALAIGLVILGHREMAGAVPFAAERLLAPLQAGVVGVRIFFVISGFLITTLLVAERDETGSIGLGRFYVRRTMRLAPALLAYVAVVALLDQAGLVHLGHGDILHALTYTTNFHDGRWYLQHTWSLSVEEQFYLLWPAIVLAFTPRRAGWIAGVVLLAGPLTRALMMHSYVVNAVDPSAFSFRGVADTLAAGCALGVLRPALHRSATYLRCLRSPVLAFAPLIAALCWGALGHPRAAVVTQLVAIVLFTVFLDRTITLPTWSARLLNAAPLAWLGRISYSLYLWQMLFTAPVGNDPWLALPITQGVWRYAGILGMATLSYYLVERPALRLRDRIERSRLKQPQGLETSAITARVMADAGTIPPRTP